MKKFIIGQSRIVSCLVLTLALSIFQIVGIGLQKVSANDTTQTLPFAKNWTNTNLIDTNTSGRLTKFDQIIALTVALFAVVPGNNSTIFINEIHYDNDGSDTGEFIEIAAPAGTDLSDYSIVLYNGGNGTSYNTTSL